MGISIEEQVEDWAKRELRDSGLSIFTKTEAVSQEISNALATAPSKQGGNGGNQPDIKALCELDDGRVIPVMIEAKGEKGKLEKLDSKGMLANHTASGKPNYRNISGFAVNGAVHYADAILEYAESYDAVIAVGINGYDDASKRVLETKIVYVSNGNMHLPIPIGNDLSMLFPRHRTTLTEAIDHSTLSDAEREAASQKGEVAIDKGLLRLNQLMNDDLNIPISSRVMLICGMIMSGLRVTSPTNPLSPLRVQSLEGRPVGDTLSDGNLILLQIKNFLDRKNLPKEKNELILRHLANVFLTDTLEKSENGESKLKRLYSLVSSDIIPYIDPERSGYLDFTGKLFNVLTEWVDIPDGGENDVVLTPRYVTDMMAKCCKVSRDDYVWDYALGTASFLISAMKLMLSDADSIANLEEREQKKAHIRSMQLLGIEKRPDIYMLAVLNMILMGDGSSNILQANPLTEFDGNYAQGPKQGKRFPASVFLLNPPYSAPGSGLVFVEKALSRMSSGRAAVLIRENSGSGFGLPYAKNILTHSTLVASIHMADIFKGRVGVRTAVFVFEVGKPHDPRKMVTFIDMSEDGYTRQRRRKASSKTNLRDTDHASERYQEVVDIVLGNAKTTDYYQEGKHVLRAPITLDGDDWAFKQHIHRELIPTEDDFRNVVAEYLSWKIKEIATGSTPSDTAGKPGGDDAEA